MEDEMIVSSIIWIISFIVIARCSKKYFFDDSEQFMYYLVALCGACCCTMISVAIFSDILVKDYIIIEYTNVPIVALVDSNEIKGDLFILTGHINQDEYYKFYIVRNDGGKVFRKVFAKSTIIYEENRTDAYISNTKNKKIYSNWVYLWLIPKFFVNETAGMYTIHVPIGTIQTGFSIDMK